MITGHIPLNVFSWFQGPCVYVSVCVYLCVKWLSVVFCCFSCFVFIIRLNYSSPFVKMSPTWPIWSSARTCSAFQGLSECTPSVHREGCRTPREITGTFNFKAQGKLLIHSTIDQLVLIRHIGLSYLSLKENECLGDHISCPSLWFVIDSQPMGNPTAASQALSTGRWALRAHRSAPAASCPEVTHSVYIFWPVIANDINTHIISIWNCCIWWGGAVQ